MSEPREPDVESIRLGSADAIVLHDWLMTVDLNSVTITHPAQKHALADLLAAIEIDTRAAHATDDEIKAAQRQVAKDMGW